MSYGWTINQRDDGGPYIIGESEGCPFPTIKAAVKNAREQWDEYDGPEFIQVFASPDGSDNVSYFDLVAGWSPSEGLEVWE